MNFQLAPKDIQDIDYCVIFRYSGKNRTQVFHAVTELNFYCNKAKRVVDDYFRRAKLTNKNAG